MPVYKDEKRGTFFYSCSLHHKKFMKRGFLTYAEAQEAERSFMALVVTNKVVKCPKFSELYQEFFKVYKETVKESTYYDAQKKCGFLIKGHIPDVKIDRITNRDLFLCRKSLMRYSQSSIDKAYLYLGKIFDFCKDYYDYDFKLFKLLPPIKDYEIHKDILPKENYIPFDDFKKFMSVIDDNQYYLLFLTAYIAGMRLGEVRGLTCEGFKGDSIYVFQQANGRLKKGKSVLTSTKSKDSNRIIPIPAFLSTMIKEYIEKNKLNGSDFLFFSSVDKKEPVGETTIKNHLKEYVKISGIKRFHFHMLRHTEATALVDSGFDKKIVSEYLGHSSDKVTEKYYLHNDESNKEGISKLLDDKFSSIFSKNI